MLDSHAAFTAIGSVFGLESTAADVLGHQVVVVAVVACTTLLVALGRVDPALAGTVFGAALGFSGGISSRRRSEDYPELVAGGARRTDPPAPTP